MSVNTSSSVKAATFLLLSLSTISMFALSTLSTSTTGRLFALGLFSFSTIVSSSPTTVSFKSPKPPEEQEVSSSAEVKDSANKGTVLGVNIYILHLGKIFVNSLFCYCRYFVVIITFSIMKINFTDVFFSKKEVCFQ